MRTLDDACKGLNAVSGVKKVLVDQIKKLTSIQDKTEVFAELRHRLDAALERSTIPIPIHLLVLSFKSDWDHFKVTHTWMDSAYECIKILNEFGRENLQSHKANKESLKSLLFPETLMKRITQNAKAKIG